jgi:hypothetical protein
MSRRKGNPKDVINQPGLEDLVKNIELEEDSPHSRNNQTF